MPWNIALIVSCDTTRNRTDIRDDPRKVGREHRKRLHMTRQVARLSCGLLRVADSGNGHLSPRILIPDV